MKMIKYFTIYELLFTNETGIELHYITEVMSKKEVLNYLEVKNLEVDRPLESELIQEFLYVEKKDGSKVQNKKYTIEHLNYKYLVISEYDRPYN